MRDSQETGKKKKIKAIGLSILAAFLAALAVTTTSVIGKDKPFLIFTAFPADAAINISLTQNNMTTNLAPSDNKVFLEQGNPRGSYILSIAIKDETGNKYRDFTISYRADTGFAHITADGFSSTDTITLSDNEKLNFDWSGRIELSAAALPENSTACLETSAGISFCHALPERTGT